MELLVTLLAVLVAIGILFEISRRLSVPYPTLFVVGGLALAAVPGLPHIELEPDLALLLFLPPILFAAAVETPTRELRTNLAPLLRLSVGLVIVTTTVVAIVANAALPGLGWGAAIALGAIVAPTNSLAATAVFRRFGAPRILSTFIEGESLFNDATALILYRVAVVAAVSGTFVFADALAGLLGASAGGVALGLGIGLAASAILRRLDDPPVEVVISIVVPYGAYLAADELGLSGVLAVVTAGLVIGSRLGTILTPASRTLWLTGWRLVDFILNGFVFVLIGLELPRVLEGLSGRPMADIIILPLVVSAIVIATRFVWVFATSLLPDSPRQVIARRDPAMARKLTVVVGWAGLRGDVSLAAALALPEGFPERDLILLVTFVVILVTLVGQGLTLPAILRMTAWDAGLDGDELTLARTSAYRAGLEEIERARERWPGHQPLLERLQSGLLDRSRHLATEDADETAERRQERLEHEEIQRSVISAERAAVIALRNRREINDQTLRTIERELDLEELRMEG